MGRHGLHVAALSAFLLGVSSACSTNVDHAGLPGTSQLDPSQQDLQDLILPTAKKVQPGDKPPELRPIINILQNGPLMYRGRPQSVPKAHGENYKPMQQADRR